MSRGPSTKTPYERFLPKVNKTKSCWNWVGWRNPAGYGQFRNNGKKIPSHRWSYEYFVGPIPRGLVIDHLCRNPSCVNPRHLEPVTIGENFARGENFQRNKMKCKRGHRFIESNIYRHVNGRWRRCRICHVEFQRKYESSKRD